MEEEFDDEIGNELNDISLEEKTSLIEESKELLKSLYDVDKNRSRQVITQDDLRNDISSFVSSQLRNLEQQNTLKGLLEAEIANKVLTHDLSTDEIFRAYSMISSEKSRNIDSLFKLFVPTQVSPNLILTPAVKNDEKESSELTPSQRQAIEKLSRIVEYSNSHSER